MSSAPGSNNPTPEQGLEAFRKTVTVYEHRVGHICRQVATHIPGLIKFFPAEGSFLDDACGTGAATEEFLKVHPHAQIYAVDITPPMVEAFRSIVNPAQVKDLQVGDAQSLNYPDNLFNAAVMNFGIFFLPDPSAGINQIYRTLKPGGTAVVTAFRTFGFQPILWAVQDRVDPATRLTALPVMGSWCDPSKLEGLYRAAGFKEIASHPVPATLWGTDVEDFKSVLLESFGMFVSRTYSDVEKAKLAPITSQVVDEMIASKDSAIIRDGDKAGCTGSAWITVGIK